MTKKTRSEWRTILNQRGIEKLRTRWDLALKEKVESLARRDVASQQPQLSAMAYVRRRMVHDVNLQRQLQPNAAPGG